MDNDLEAVIDWLSVNITRLREQRCSATLTLHIGGGGDVKFEIKTLGELLPARKHRQQIQEIQETR